MNDVRRARRIESPVSEKAADRNTTRLGGRRGRWPNGIPKDARKRVRERNGARLKSRASEASRGPGQSPGRESSLTIEYPATVVFR